MTQTILGIESKVVQYNQLKEELYKLERELKSDLTDLDKNAFNGQTWYEYLKTIDETIQVNDKMVIKRESYRITGTYQLSDNAVLTLDTAVYVDKSVYNSTIHYKETDRYVTQTVPKKYSNQFEELKAEMEKYKFERPSDKYSRQAGLTSF